MRGAGGEAHGGIADVGPGLLVPKQRRERSSEELDGAIGCRWGGEGGRGYVSRTIVDGEEGNVSEKKNKERGGGVDGRKAHKYMSSARRQGMVALLSSGIQAHLGEACCLSTRHCTAPSRYAQ